MKQKIALILFFIIIVKGSIAQSSGDFRSKQTGYWIAATSWQTYNGSAWIDAATAPSSTDGAITILSGHTITANSNITADQVIINANGSLNITSAIFTLNNGAGTDLLNNGTLTLSGGTQNGNGSVEIVSGSAFNWTGGAFGGGGNLKIGAGASLNMSTNTHYLADSVTVNNYGTWTWTGGTFYYYDYSPIVNNFGTFNINTDNDVDRYYTNTGTFTNKGGGVINKTGSTSNDTYFANISSFINDGTISVDSGTITMDAKYVNTGTINLGANGTMNFANNSIGIIEAGSIIKGLGNFNVNNSTDSILTTNVSVKTINIIAGTLTVMDSLNIKKNNIVNLGNATLNGAGTLTFSAGSTFNWSAGYLSQAGVIAIDSGAAFNMYGTTHYLADTRTINNTGTWTWTGGNLDYYNGSPVVNNYGTFNINTDYNVDHYYTTTGTFTNKATGILNKTGSTTDDTYFANISSFTNSGTINIDSGTISMISKYINTGIINLGANGTINFTNNGIALIKSGSIVQGSGNFNVNNSTDSIMTPNISVKTINITAGTLTLMSSFAIKSGNALNLSNGNLNGTGILTFNSGGTFNWTGGYLSQAGTITVMSGGIFNMSGSNHYLADTRTINNNGIWTWTGGNLYYYNGSPVINNSGTFNIYTDADVSNTYFNAGTFSNKTSGIINKIGSPNDDTRFQGFNGFTNAGIINVNSSTFRSYVKYTNTGSINVSFGAGINFTGGTGNFNTGTKLSGEGNLTFDGGVDSINTATISLNTINITAGTLIMKPSMTIKSGGVLNLSGGTLNGTANWSFNSGSTFNWAGGTNGGSGIMSIKTGANFNLNGSTAYLTDTKTINNSGVWTWSNGNLQFYGGSPSVNNNGTFNINTDADMVGSNATIGTFTNQATGIINKTGSPSADTYFNSIGSFSNTGIINVNSGIFRVNTKHINTNLLNVALGAGLNFTGGAGNFNTGSVIKGSGSISFDGATDSINAASISIKNFNVSAGTITVTPAIIMASGTVFNLSGGTLNGSGNLTFNSGSTFNWAGGTNGGSGIMNINAGASFNLGNNNVYLSDTKTINNAGTWIWTGGTLYFYGGSPTVNNSGTFNINADVDLLGSNGTAGTFTNQPSGVINKIGSFNANTTISSISAFSNAGTVNINSSALALNISGTHTGLYNIKLGAQLGGTLNMNYLGSAFTNNGAVTLTGLSFSGATAQALNGTGNIKALTINNTAGLILGGTQTVATSLALTNGNMKLGNNNLLLGTAAMSGGSPASYIVTNGTGALQRRIINNNTSIVFPVGVNSYTPASIAFTAASTSDDISVRVLPNVYSDYTTNSVPAGSTVTANSVNNTWVMAESNAGGSVATTTLQWNNSDEATGFNRVNSRIGHYINNSWTLDPAVAAAGTDPYTVTTSGITTFSPVIVTNEFVTNTNQYSSLCSGNNVSVPYIAVGNFNSGNKFTAQLSNAAGSFASPVNIGSQNTIASGTINATIPASTTAGTGYKIRVISNNPSFAGSDNGSNIAVNNCAKNSSPQPLIAETENINKQEFKVYPNPNNGRLLISLLLKNSINNKASVNITTISGQVIYSSTVAVINGALNKTIFFNNTTPNGMYLLRIITDNEVFTEKIIYSK